MTTTVTVKTHGWAVEVTKHHEGREPETDVVPVGQVRDYHVHQQLSISVRELPSEPAS